MMRGADQDGSCRACRARLANELSAYSSVGPPRCYVLGDTLKRSDEGMREKEVERSTKQDRTKRKA